MEFQTEFANPVIHLAGHVKAIYPWIQHDLHTPFWRCYWSVSEGGYLVVNNQTIPLKTDCLYIIPAHLHFSTYAKKPMEQYYLHFSLPEQQLSNNTEILIAPINSQWTNMWYEWESLVNVGKSLRFRQHLLAEAILAEALLALPAEFMSNRKSLSPEIQTAISLLQTNIASPLDNSTLAKCAKVGLRTFLRRFREEIGESPQQRSRRMRIEIACQYLLNTSKSIDEIAELTGFPDRYYFGRVFRQIQKKSPCRFRSEYQIKDKSLR